MRKLLFLIILIIYSENISAQEGIHWLINQDSITDCNYLKKGTFRNKETCCKATEGYTIEFAEDYVIEKIEDGKYYVKSAIIFTSECNYELTVSESNNSEYEEMIGQKVYGEILETATIDKLVKVNVRSGETSIVVVFEKVER